MVALTRAFGWHRPESTPCGQPVPISEAHALLELSRGIPMSQTELGAALNLRKSTVSRLVGNLSSRGWLERTRNEADGRAWDLGLTPAGMDAAATLARARQARMDGILRRIPVAERSKLMDSLTTLIGAINELDD